MTDPIEVLGLSGQATDAEIRGRYLQLVREFPPDRAPERFAEIRAAYDELRNPLARLEKQLFSTHSRDSLDALGADLRRRLQNSHLTRDALFALADRP